MKTGNIMAPKGLIYIVLLSLILASCGGGAGGGGNDQSDPAPPTLESISIILDKTFFLYWEDPVPIKTNGLYSDGSVNEISSGVSYVIGPSDIGSVSSTPSGYVFEPGEVGSGTIEASIDGLNSSVDIQVNSYISAIEASQNAYILPLNANVPLLAWAWARVQGAPDINIIDSLQYEALDTSVADFLPKTDPVIINDDRDTSVGHLQTKSVGTTGISLTYDSLPPLNTNVEVVDMRLFTSSLTSTFSPSIYGVDSTDDSVFYVWGDLGVITGNFLTISQYSTITGSWLDDINIEYTGSSLFYTRIVSIEADNNRIFVTWASSDGIYVSITRLSDRVTTVEKISSTPGDSVQYNNAPEIVMDALGRTAVCWMEVFDSHCRLYVPGTGWLAEQPFDFRVLAKLVSNNAGVGYFAYVADNSSGISSLWVQEFHFDNTGILLSPRVELASPADIYGSFDLDINDSGDAVLTFTQGDLLSGEKLYAAVSMSGSTWSVSEVDQTTNDIRGAMAGIAPNGEVLIAYGDATSLLFKFLSYNLVDGWQPVTSLPAAGAATPVVKYKPMYLNNNWILPRDGASSPIKFFRYVTGDWEALMDIQAMGQWAPVYGTKFIYNDAGYFSLAWYESWAFTLNAGGFKNNGLYFGYPVVRLW